LHKLNNDQLSKKYFVVCNILGSHGGAAEDSSPLGCDTVTRHDTLSHARGLKETSVHNVFSSVPWLRQLVASLVQSQAIPCGFCGGQSGNG